MAAVNRVFLCGNTTRDAVLKATKAGVSYARFALAVNSRRKGEQDTLFIECSAFGVAAEVAAELGKGSQVFIEGRLQLNVWQTQDGQSRREIRVVADRVEVLSAKPRAEAQREPEAVGVGVVNDEVSF